jgi:DNA-directed RNA polymerase beta' subunit
MWNTLRLWWVLIDSSRRKYGHADMRQKQDEQRMRPRTKGPNDPRLGTLDRQYYCETCEEGQKECPGHYGHIELATPVFHIGMLRGFMSKCTVANRAQVF